MLRFTRFNTSAFLAHESLECQRLASVDADSVCARGIKFLLRQLLVSVRLTIVHSRVLRRFVSLRGLPAHSNTVVKFRDMLVSGGKDVVDVIETTNGVMITEIDTDKVRQRLGEVTARWLQKRGRFVANDPETGFYKRLFRLKFVYDHLGDVYADKYNIYQAAYVDPSYTVRALLCFVMQIISSLALMKEGVGDGETSLARDDRRPVDMVLIIVTIMYMFYNLPANSITSSMSHDVILFDAFARMNMYRKLVFVAMDLIVNCLILSLMPLVSARLLYKTADSSSIVATLLSVFFVTSLDDSAITKSESNNMTASQTALLREVTEKVDSYVDSDGMRVVAHLPWVEMLLLVASVIASYVVLL